MQQVITDDLEALLAVVPPDIAAPLHTHPRKSDLLEIVMDLGRRPEARFPGDDIFLNDRDVTEEDIEYVVSRIGQFGDDNRAGIPRTLHRISAIRNRQGKIVGLTLRVGRAVYGTVRIIQDLIESGKSILLLGRPGVGKTTMLREAARVLADDLRKRVVIVDTSNEIAGDGDIPHPAIGRARRMQVKTPALQHAVMIEAVENHMPEVIVIDEIGTSLEAEAARTIAERGVQLIATAHGNTLENLIMNPTLADLVGGVQAVTLSDEEARRRGTQKTILERKAPPTFDVVVEIQSWTEVAVHPDVAEAVDLILRGIEPPHLQRRVLPDGTIQGFEPQRVARPAALPEAPGLEVPEKPLRILAYGVSRDRLAQVARGLQLPVIMVDSLAEADAVMTLKNFYRKKPQLLREAEAQGIPVYVLRSNTIIQMEQALTAMFGLSEQAAGEGVRTGRSEETPVGHQPRFGTTVKVVDALRRLRSYRDRAG